MSAGDFSGIVTAVLLLAFVYGVIWLWSDRRKSMLDEASRLPLDDEWVESKDKGARP